MTEPSLYEWEKTSNGPAWTCYHAEKKIRAYVSVPLGLPRALAVVARDKKPTRNSLFDTVEQAKKWCEAEMERPPRKLPPGEKMQTRLGEKADAQIT